MTGWGGAAVPAAAVAAAAAAARAYARADAAEDALLARMAGTAIAVGEAFLGQALVARGFVDRIEGGGAWRALAAAPVLAIDAVDALAADGTANALPVTGYAVDIGTDGRGWVRSGVRARVSYTAGLSADWDGLPDPLKQGVAMLAAHLLDAREGAAPPAAVSALWRPWRRMRL